jgi:hypothetical protein
MRLIVLKQIIPAPVGGAVALWYDFDRVEEPHYSPILAYGLYEETFEEREPMQFMAPITMRCMGLAFGQGSWPITEESNYLGVVGMTDALNFCDAMTEEERELYARRNF